ncbi:PIR Superfamily Protein [Plasmodium ovale curtisi]|uniref:PIR Superfamily Protein n=1 Tax=Plasmodium ovale curtisi TaxID=864141 RepID=A0A1A8VQ31_PLAOA|nr:PIR Superfamily Protein [Plasmodium ovale curtisi]
METEESIKQQHFITWDKELKTNEEEVDCNNALLTGLKNQNKDLYKLGCALTENYKSAGSMRSSQPNICSFLNEWLNNRKKINTDNGTNSKNNELWETYIENLWIQLEKDRDCYYWCRRSYPFSIKYSILRNSLCSYVNKKFRFQHILDKDVSNELLGTPFEYTDSYSANERINIAHQTI